MQYTISPSLSVTPTTHCSSSTAAASRLRRFGEDGDDLNALCMHFGIAGRPRELSQPATIPPVSSILRSTFQGVRVYRALYVLRAAAVGARALAIATNLRVAERDSGTGAVRSLHQPTKFYGRVPRSSTAPSCP